MWVREYLDLISIIYAFLPTSFMDPTQPFSYPLLGIQPIMENSNDNNPLLLRPYRIMSVSDSVSSVLDAIIHMNCYNNPNPMMRHGDRSYLINYNMLIDFFIAFLAHFSLFIGQRNNHFWTFQIQFTGLPLIQFL